MEDKSLKVVAASFDVVDDLAEMENFLRVWQISDGRHFVYIIYRSEDWYDSHPVRPQELRDCEEIVAGIKF
jgi:hypothetical protein